MLSSLLPQTREELKTAIDMWCRRCALPKGTEAGPHGHISMWITTFITDMDGLFSNKSNFNDDISAWDTSNVTTMHRMFYKAYSFNGDIFAWDTSNVTTMRRMFCKAKSFNQDISVWDTSRVADMGKMFQDAIAFHQDISKWNTGSVTDMQAMFFDAQSFEGTQVCRRKGARRFGACTMWEALGGGECCVQGRHRQWYARCGAILRIQACRRKGVG